MLTSSSLFTGFGGADLGAQMTGLTPVCALEYDRDIASVYESNFGPHIRVMDFLELDLSTWPRTDHVHFSPPCPNFSVAKAGGVETAHDIALARKVAEAITTLLPRFITIENVPAYKKSESFKLIARALDSSGYYWDAPILNSADFGVPQTRKRMMLRAVRGSMLRELPPPTPWRGWFAATEDLHAILPDSEFAPWQLKRMAGLFTQLIGGANTSDEQAAQGVGVSREDEPTLAVNTNPAWRAFLENKNNSERGDERRPGDEPTYTTVPGDGSRLRAFLMPNANSTSHVIRTDDEPMCAVGNTERVGNVPRAYIVQPSEQRDTPILPAESPLFTVLTQENRGSFSPRAFICADQRSNGGQLALTRDSEEPTITVDTRDAGKVRAFLVDGNINEGERINVRESGEPMLGIKASDSKRPVRAWLTYGRVVKMTPRALARFQAFPDSFRLPSKPAKRKFLDEIGKAWNERIMHAELTARQQEFLMEYLFSNDKLACKGIGNAVPPQFLAAQIKCLLGE